MAWTQADVEALERAIADGRGARSMTFSDGQSVTLSSPAEMLGLLSSMKGAIAAAAGTSTTRYAAFSKGV
jgi:hypothetical protein